MGKEILVLVVHSRCSQTHDEFTNESHVVNVMSDTERVSFPNATTGSEQ